MDFVPTRWCPPRCTAIDIDLFRRPDECDVARCLGRWYPLPYMAGGADQIFRSDKCDGALRKAVTSIDTNLSRRIRSVLRDGYWREGIPWRPGCCEVNISPPDDGGG